jgi:hypothetical protein
MARPMGLLPIQTLVLRVAVQDGLAFRFTGLNVFTRCFPELEVAQCRMGFDLHRLIIANRPHG